MSSLLGAFVLSLTVLTVVVLGVLAAYAAVTGVLHLFARKTRERRNGAPVLVPSQTHASGD